MNNNEKFKRSLIIKLIENMNTIKVSTYKRKAGRINPSLFYIKITEKEGVSMETISIALACTLIGSMISYLTFQRNKNNDIRANSREEAKTEAKLDYIATAVDEIRIDNKARDREIKDLRERVIIVETSSKSAHKRIDTLEKEIIL